ncbi:MAG: 3-deoxy-manno-octulosonate cytidylyltransferase [Gammaproteobacteria bacterium]
MKVRIIIPARLKSKRFPNKLVKNLKGKSIIEHVCLRAKKLNYDSLIVATDSNEIKTLIDNINIETYLSKKKYLNGTERIADLCKKRSFGKNDIIINIQGDELNFPVNAVNKMINYLKKSKEKIMTTVIVQSNNRNHYINKDCVKVITNKNDNALCFSRSPLPYDSSSNYLLHIGLYGYKVSLLNEYSSFKKSMQEAKESLEQLRFLYNHVEIKCIKLKSHNSISINSPNDLKLAQKLIR